MHSEQINELFTALSKAQGEMTEAKLDKINPHFKNKYSSLAALQAATRPILAKHGLTVLQVPQQVDGGLILETWLGHTSGQFIQSEWFIPVNENIQRLGSYLTYVKRYSWGAILGISGGDDDDGENAVEQPKQKKTQPKPTPQNGNGSKSKPPTSPKDLLELINKRVEVPYDNVHHLFNAVCQESTLDEYEWPNPKDIDAWRQAYKYAYDHAKAKTQPAEQATFTDDPQPTNYDE